MLRRGSRYVRAPWRQTRQKRVGNRDGVAVPRLHKAQVLLRKYVAGRPLKYSAESMAGCDTTTPAFGSALSFISGLPAIFIFSALRN